MSCNGCQALREGCNENCILRQSLHGIKNHQAQANATVFAAKFFGRAGLMYLLSSVPESQRPALFQSLLFEACGRTVNPVNGAVGLLWTGNWHVCQSAVETVLGGEALLPISKSPAEGASDTNNIDLFGSQDHLRFSRTQNNGQELTTERQNLSAMNMKSMLNYENLQMMMSERGSGQRMRRIEREQRCMTTTWEGRYFCGIRFGTRKKTRPSMIKVTSLVPVVETAGLGASEGSVVT